MAYTERQRLADLERYCPTMIALRDGPIVLAKQVHGYLSAKQFTNLTAAKRAAAKIETHTTWIWQSPASRVFYVRFDEVS